MRIDKTSEPILFSLYDEYQAYKKNNTTAYRNWKANELIKRNNTTYEIEQYCSSMGFNTIDKAEKVALFTKMYLSIDEKMFGGDFNVEYISKPFIEGVETNVNKLLNSIAEENYYEAFGECSGFLILKDYIVSYAVIEHCAYFIASHRTIDSKGGQQFFFGNHILKNTSDWKILTDLEQCICLAISVLIIKKYGEVETVLIGSGVNRRIANSENIFNKSPFKIKQLDCSWLRTIIRTEGFLVSGHFRLQPYGEGRALRKLIYIEPFEKHGYTRQAKKLTEE